MTLLERYKQNSNKPKIAVVGDVMYDEYFVCDITGLSPEDEVALKVKPYKTFSRPGGAANVAANLARMNAQTYLFSCVADDAEGNILYEDLSEIGVSPRLTFSGRTQTTKKTRYMTTKGRHLFRVDREDTHWLDDKSMEIMLDDIKAFAPYDLIVVSDYNKGVVSDRLMREINKLGYTFIVDPKGDSYKKYGQPLLLTPNEQEVRILDKACSLSGACYNNINILITMSDRGSRLITANIFKDIPVRRRDFGDPAGCGDAAIAGAAMAISKHLSLEDAGYIANAAGACAFDHTGVYAVTEQDLLAELAYPIYKGENK